MRPGRSASVEEGSGGETNPESLQEKQAGVLSVPMTEEGESNKHPRLREAARAVASKETAYCGRSLSVCVSSQKAAHRAR
jgi:hypothetical protein